MLCARNFQLDPNPHSLVQDWGGDDTGGLPGRPSELKKKSWALSLSPQSSILGNKSQLVPLN